MKVFFVLFAVVLICGCASPDYNYTPISIEVSEPPIGSINTIYVGEIMVKQGSYREHDSIYLPEEIDVSLAYDLLPGFYLKEGEDEDSETYMPYTGYEGGGVDRAALADPWVAILASKDRDRLCVVTIFNLTSCKDTDGFERRVKQILTEDSFQQTLIYNGRVENKINIAYREFSNNLARPAFNNDVEYDLGSSEIIGYRGARIRVLEATNEIIRFELISNFNDAQL